MSLDVSASQGPIQVRWLDIDRTRWHEPQTVNPNKTLQLKAPGQGHWAAVIQRATSPNP